MPIKDLQSAEEGLARAGVIRLGYKAKRCKTSGCSEIVEAATVKCPKCNRAEFGKEFPTEAPYFVLSDAPGVAEVLKTDKPVSLNIFFPFDTVDENFPAFMQSWVSSSLVCRGDGDKILHAIELTTGKPWIKEGKVTRDFEEEKKQYVAGEIVACPGLERNLYKKCERCKPNAMLLVMLRDVPRLAYWQISTTSIHNIRNLTKQLNYVRNVVNDLTGSPKLSGVPFILHRVKRMTSVPKTDQNGKANGRQRVEKWFIELEIEPAWILRMLSALKRLADPMQRFMIPATVTQEGDVFTEPVGATPGYAEAPVWEPRYDEPEEAEEASWEPAEEEAPAPPEPPKTNGKVNGPRPQLPPAKLREILQKKVENSALKDPNTGEYLPISYHPFGEKTGQILASRFQAAFKPGAQEGEIPETPEAMYKTCLYWLTGHLSAKDLTAAWADAILDWLVNGNKAEKFKASLVPPAPAEAMAIYQQAHAELDEQERKVEADQEMDELTAEAEMDALWPEDELPGVMEALSYPD